MAVLQAKLLERKRQEEAAAMSELRGETTSSWGTQIRNYVLHPYQIVKDLRTGVEAGNPTAVLDGDLDGFIEGEIRWMRRQAGVGRRPSAVDHLQRRQREGERLSTRGHQQWRHSQESMEVQPLPGAPAGGAATFHHRMGTRGADQVFAAHRPFTYALIVLFPLWTFHASVTPRLSSGQPERRSGAKRPAPPGMDVPPPLDWHAVMRP